MREYLTKRLRGLYVDVVEIERSENVFRVIIKTSRPGMVIGRSGEGATKLKADILKAMKRIGNTIPKEVKVDIEEIKDAEAHAAIVGYMVAEALEKRMPFRRILKQTIEKVMAQRNVQGVKINLSGRLGGAEMGRRETQKAGRIPLQTLRADVDLSRKAYLPYGVIESKFGFIAVKYLIINKPCLFFLKKLNTANGKLVGSTQTKTSCYSWGNPIVWVFGLKAETTARIRSNQIEAIVKLLPANAEKGKLWIRIFPDRPLQPRK